MNNFYNEARQFAEKFIDPIAKEIDEQDASLKKYLKNQEKLDISN